FGWYGNLEIALLFGGWHFNLQHWVSRFAGQASGGLINSRYLNCPMSR
ncbi:MAG: hypothetical protein RIS02_990, partial [Pseudomonadota bacterium]